MDLLSIARTVWRHKLATIPVILIMLIGMFYVLALKAPVYRASSTYILTPAAQAPTADQIAKNPALKGVNANNPFAAYGDLAIVADILTERMNSVAEGDALLKQGLSSAYSVAPLTTTYGGNAPIIQIITQGASAASAVSSATLVGNAVQNQLASIQAAQGTSRRYWIGSLELSRPGTASLQLSSQLRDFVAVIAVGLILLFAVVSTMNAIEERKRGAMYPEEAEHHELSPVRSPEPERLRVLRRRAWVDLDDERTADLSGPQPAEPPQDPWHEPERGHGGSSHSAK